MSASAGKYYEALLRKAQHNVCHDKRNSDIAPPNIIEMNNVINALKRSEAAGLDSLPTKVSCAAHAVSAELSMLFICKY